MEPIEEVPEIPEGHDEDMLLVRRVPPNEQGLSGVQILDTKYQTRIEIRHGQEESDMFAEVIRLDFAAWLLAALADLEGGDE